MKWLLFFIIILIFSCSNSNNVEEYSLDEGTTLRKIAEDINETIQWENDLSEDDTSKPGEKNDLSYTVISENDNALFFLLQENVTPVYPSLDGFGSLNTDSIPSILLVRITDFLDDLRTADIDKSFFNNEKQYLKTIIEYNFQNFTDYTHYIIGEAFAFDNPANAYEIPIRLYFDNGYVDCFLFCILNKGVYEIEQFDIGTLINE